MGDGWEEKVKDALSNTVFTFSAALWPSLFEDRHFLSTHTLRGQQVYFLFNMPLSSFSGGRGSENQTGKIYAAAEVG